MTRTMILAGVVFGALFLSACTGGDDDDDMATIPCSEETRDDTYVLGLEKQGITAVLRSTLDSAQPAPPDVGNNTWTITVYAAGGTTPLDGCTITSDPDMPDHGHGTSPEPTITATGNPGEYEVAPINMFMGGLWEVPLVADCGGAGSDTIVYRFCVEG